MAASDHALGARLRTYDRATSVVFLKTKEAFGGLSNMAGGFPLRVNGVRILTSEALYQACRFPHLPDVQKLIIEQASPMSAKMVGKPHRTDSRPDWDAVRVKIMRWSLRVKLIQNFAEFSRLLLATRDRPIVEESRKDDFWGAKPIEPNVLVGQNVLGRLLMELREELRDRERWPVAELAPLDLPEFLFLGRPIELVRGDGAITRTLRPAPVAPPSQPDTKPDLFELPKDRMSPNAPPVGSRKKLIEVSIPLDAINAASKKQKAPKGYPTTLHKYWAPRPLAACRGVLFAQLVDDPCSWPTRFDTLAAVETERRRLHHLIERLVPWDASNNEQVLNEARWEIARSVAWGRGEEPPPRTDSRAVLAYLRSHAPAVYDPFSGAASIPLEAQRLGLRVYGSDLNPLAVMIGKALVEIPPKFAGRPPVNPEARAKVDHSGGWHGRGAQGLADDLRYYGAWMRDEAARRVGHLYPDARLPDGSNVKVIAWLWARTVRSPDPVAKGAMVPLVTSFVLSTKEGRKAWAKPKLDGNASDGWTFEVLSGPLSKSDEDTLKKGTKSGHGANFTCVLTGSPISGKYIKEEGAAGRMSARLMSIVAEGAKGRVYLSPGADHEVIALSASIDQDHGDLPLSRHPQYMGCVPYGLDTVLKLFTPRQAITLSTLADLTLEIRNIIVRDAEASGLASDSRPLSEGGTGAAAYADAVATYLAFAVDRAADYGSTLSTWLPDDNAIRGTFGRQALPMTWDYCEGNYFGDSSAAIRTIIRTISDVVEHQNPPHSGSIILLDAAKNSYPEKPCVINTDPPYYDNVPYADLSDFFYFWLRRAIGPLWPGLFRRLATPKDQELVADVKRHGGREEAHGFFMEGMGQALCAMRVAATETEPLVIYYAFKQAEASTDGLTSAGWASFLQAVVDAGLVIDGTWPLRTESGARLRANQANALASSIVLVCRKRPTNAGVATRAEFVRALKREMPDAIAAIRKAGVGPVDMQQSVIGPGMGVLTRFAKVLEDDDSAMPVKTALSLINRVWDEIENELSESFDAPTQVALAWFSTYGFDARPSGELITLANAKNVPLATLLTSGVFQSPGGKASLVARENLPADWSPATDKAPTVWECVQHTIRVLNAEDGGADAAAALVAHMGSRAEDARALAYRLFEIATQKGWAAEALVYNALAQEWPRLADMTPEVIARRPVAAAQASLF